jgi:hypothetical protein
MSERAFWEIIYRSLMAIAAAIKRYKLGSAAERIGARSTGEVIDKG